MVYNPGWIIFNYQTVLYIIEDVLDPANRMLLSIFQNQGR